MALSESDVQAGLDSLTQKRLVTADEGFSGRVTKYQHRFCNTEFGDLQFNPQQRAIVCITLLRGPQTPGELRTRSNRLAEFSNVQAVEQELEQLINQQYMVKLEREPGKRESRFANQFTEQDFSEQQSPLNTVSTTGENVDEVAQLRQEIAALRSELAAIKDHLGL